MIMASHKSKEESELEQKIKKLKDQTIKLDDEFNKLFISARAKSFALKKKLYSFEIKRVESSYYDMPLVTRKNILGAPGEEFLCKSIVMENTAFQPEYEHEYYKKYYCVLIQYTTQINAEKLSKTMRDIQNEKCEKKLGKKNFHFRLAPSDKSFELTGYDYNAVTPFCLKTNLTIILSDQITKLNPYCFWMGGGDVDLKIRIGIDEFLNKCGFKVHIGDISMDL